MNKEKLKKYASSAASRIIPFVIVTLSIPFFLEWVLPSCFKTRIGCMGEPVLLIVGIKLGTILVAAGTFYLALKYAPGMAGGKRQ